MASDVKNPFPGPQPYRTADKERFFGREEMAQKLADRIFVHTALTLYGPSGAGKSSLMAAGVIPILDDEHDMRVVRVEAWPAAEVPLSWLTSAVFGDLELGNVPADKNGVEALREAMRLGRMQSDRPILLYLDQLEQILLPGRDMGQAAELLDALDNLATTAGRGLHLVLALREDYLGRLRDRARGKKALLEQGFRLGALNVGEMVKAVVLAAGKGEPPQTWKPEAMRKLMMEVRVPGESAMDEAEVQAAFGQIVCRAMWVDGAVGRKIATAQKAEEILRRYLDDTVAKLGVWEGEARRLLEEYLVDKEGNRRPLTEKEARGALSKQAADEVLRRLEQEAVLRAEEHQGSRYFELGHDWLAKRVFEQREERRKREELERAEKARAEKEAAKEAEERAKRRTLQWIAAVAVVVAVLMAGVVVWALGERNRAQRAEAAATEAERKSDQMAGLAKKAAQKATDNANEARENAERAKAEEAKRKEEAAAYKANLGKLEKRIETASLAELQKIKAEVREKAGLPTGGRVPKGIGGAIPPPP